MSSGCALLKGKILQVPQKPLHLSKPTHWSFRRPQIVFQIKILSKQSNKWSRSTKSYNKKKSSRMPHSLSSRSLKTRKVSTKTRKVPPLAAIMGWLKSRATERKSTKDSNFSTWYWSHWFLFSWVSASKSMLEERVDICEKKKNKNSRTKNELAKNEKL